MDITMDSVIDLKEVEELINKKAEDVMDVLYQEVYQATPVVTGRLRSSLDTYYEPDTGEGCVYFTCEYAPYVELRGKSAGFFNNAVESATSKLNQVLKGGIS